MYLMFRYTEIYGDLKKMIQTIDEITVKTIMEYRDENAENVKKTWKELIHGTKRWLGY